MARKKGSKNNSNKITEAEINKAKRKDPMIDDIVEVEIEFTCPIKGKVKQKVKMKRLKSMKDNAKQVITNSEDLASLDDDNELPPLDDEVE
jgi:hypothetical protein